MDCHVGSCPESHTTQRVVLTGGPGGGKTAILELIRVSSCTHVRVLPEAAGVVFGGGFPREDGVEQGRAAQRAIFQVQRELEAIGEADNAAVVLCDRGTVDGAAYWPGDVADLWPAVHSDLDSELARYATVIHVRTPPATMGYNRTGLRTETVETAGAIDARIGNLWASHPRVVTIEPQRDFLAKAEAALVVVRSLLPACCQDHVPSSPTKVA